MSCLSDDTYNFQYEIVRQMGALFTVNKAPISSENGLPTVWLLGAGHFVSATMRSVDIF